MLPRPDLSQLLNITYRRIPVLAIDREVYCDTRIILPELSRRFPGNESALAQVKEDDKLTVTLLENWADEVLLVVVQLLPEEALPFLRDERFRKDRMAFWNKGSMKGGTREELLSEMRRLFDWVERVLLREGRKWVLGGEAPTVADIVGK